MTALQEQLGDLRQKTGVLEGNLQAVTVAREQMTNVLRPSRRGWTSPLWSLRRYERKPVPGVKSAAAQAEFGEFVIDVLKTLSPDLSGKAQASSRARLPSWGAGAPEN